MAEVVLYTTPWCPYCIRARRLLDERQASYRDIDVSADPALRREMIERSGRTSVPQIWIGERHVGGSDDLYRLARSGELDTLLNQ